MATVERRNSIYTERELHIRQVKQSVGVKIKLEYFFLVIRPTIHSSVQSSKLSAHFRHCSPQQHLPVLLSGGEALPGQAHYIISPRMTLGSPSCANLSFVIADILFSAVSDSLC